MALFGFGSKKEVKVGKGEIPVEKAKNLLMRGFSEIEVIDTLRKEGYSPEEIDKALMQAVPEVKASLTPSASSPTSTITNPTNPAANPVVTPATPISQTSNITSQTIQQTSSQPLYQSISTPNTLIQQPSEKNYETPIAKNFEKTEKVSMEEILPNVDYVSLEEYLDYLIKEKISELNKRLIETNLKFKDIEERLISLKEEIENIKKGTKDDINKILNEIRFNRDSINDLSLQVETLNKTLKELLPSLVESVRLLGEIVQKLKT